ncbi:hypothetical protein F5Y16DRAFT_387838 [Xylariaceae sp. FL0255]|nr:hypothetical protein F5Y16DRAFT_387838 [Xylariaceae sp. FL0255]
MPGYHREVVSDLTDLPNDVFLLIISYLSPRENVLARRVSKAWRATFTAEYVCSQLMRWHFPRAREISAAAGATQREEYCRRSWSCIFARVACRYFHLVSATPRQIEKVEDIVKTTAGVRTLNSDSSSLFRSVQPWDRWLSWNHHAAPFQHLDANWDLHDGLLVYPKRNADAAASSGNSSGQYVAYNLDTKTCFPIPFDTSSRIVRRLRLTQGVLVIEWCQRQPLYKPGDQPAQLHFATFFDVKRSAANSALWDISFRSELSINHPFGLPLKNEDRFFSAHTDTHYAVYLWQPNFPPGEGEDNVALPDESLVVWDISNSQPSAVRMFTSSELEDLGLRQGCKPTLRQILLDEKNVYVHEEDHRWLVGAQSSLSTPPRHHHVRCTGIPFAGNGPHWFDECSANGDSHMSYCPRAGSNSAATWAGFAPCWRHEEFPYLTVSDVVDKVAGVRFTARRCFKMEALSVSVVAPAIPGGGGTRGKDRVGPKSLGEEKEEGKEESEIRFSDEMWQQVLGRGKIAGDERWLVGEDAEGNITVVRF